MKTLNITVCLCILFFAASCDKDGYYQDAKSNERQILWVSVPGQVGSPGMPDKNALDLYNTITVGVMPDADIRNLPVTLALSPKAMVVPASGAPQDFTKGAVKYTVTSETGKSREFQLVVTPFEEIFHGQWKVASVEVSSEMDRNYPDYEPRWPAPGMGQKVGEPFYYQKSGNRQPFNPTVNGVELDNVLTFSFMSFNGGNTFGSFATDSGADGKTASKSIVLDFLTLLNVTEELGEAVHYPDDINWLPAAEGTTWLRDVVGNTITFTSNGVAMKCGVTIVTNDKIVLDLPVNPNWGNAYSRPNNGWLDRYDYATWVIYTIERLN